MTTVAIINYMLGMLIGHYQEKNLHQVSDNLSLYTTPYDLNEQGGKITGAVDGTLVLVDYSWKMPRYDLSIVKGQLEE